MIIDVVIPAYNESERIVPTLKTYGEALKKWDSRIIVVDDGSADSTAETVRAVVNEVPVPLECHVLEQNSGKGAAVRTGVSLARDNCDAVVFADADGSTPADEFDNLINHYKNGVDVVLASRAIGTENVRQHWLRRTMGQIFNCILRLLMPTSFKDTQCGFKLFSSKVIPLILKKSKLDRFAFDVEWILIALANGFVVKEVPVSWHHVEASRVHLIKDSCSMFFDLLSLRRRWIMGEFKD